MKTFNEYLDEGISLEKSSTKKAIDQLKKTHYNNSYRHVGSKRKWQNKDYDDDFEAEVDNEYMKRIKAHLQKNPHHKRHFKDHKIN